MGDEAHGRNDSLKFAAENLRFYGDMRFKQLTLFSIVTAFLLNAAVSKDAQQLLATHRNLTSLSVAGMLFTAVLWIMEVASTLYGVRYLRPVRDELDRLEEQQESEKVIRHWTLLNATNAVVFAYFASYVFWWWMWKAAGKMTCAGYVGWVLFGLAGLFLVLFTGREYCQLWKFSWSKWKCSEHKSCAPDKGEKKKTS